MLKKIRERREKKREEQRKHDEHMAYLDKIMRELNPQNEESMQQDADYHLARMNRRYETHERIFGFIRIVVFTPLIKIFYLANMVLRLVLGASAFGFFYGVYLAYKNFANKADVNIGIMIVCLVAPFIISLVTFSTEYLMGMMEDSL
jgi:hypothetical protein